MKTISDPRHRVRFKLVQHLFSSSFRDKPDPLVLHIWEKLSVIDPIITDSAPEWPLDKLNPIDLAILRLAVFELVIDKQEPYKVIIDEAVELAKTLGSDNSSSFINGALGKIVTTHGIKS